MIVQLHPTTWPISASRNNRPAAFNDSADLSFLQWSSSCIQRHDRPQLPTTIVQLHLTTRLTSASCNNHSAALYDSTDSYPHQTSSCISTTRPTPATRVEHPAVHIYDSTIPVIDIIHLAEDPNKTVTDFTHTFVIPTINRHFCCICYLAFVPFIVFGCHYLHALNLIHLWGQHAYRLCNRSSSVRWPNSNDDISCSSVGLKRSDLWFLF